MSETAQHIVQGSSVLKNQAAQKRALAEFLLEQASALTNKAIELNNSATKMDALARREAQVEVHGDRGV